MRRQRGARGERASNPLSALSRWKIFDNLRRSLVPIALVALLVIAWFCLPAPAFWAAFVVEILIVPAIVDLALAIAGPRDEGGAFEAFKRLLGDAAHRVAQIAVNVALLPFEAWLSADAIARTYWRVHVSRRRLLQWAASSNVQARERNRLGSSIAAMWIAPAAALAIGLLLWHRGSFAQALPWLAAWFVSPVIAWLLSTAPRARVQTLDAPDVLFLRGIARRTWNFFERFVGLWEARKDAPSQPNLLSMLAHDPVTRKEGQPYGYMGNVVLLTVAGSDTTRSQATELWTFLRSPGGRWVLSAIQQAR